MEIIRQPPYSVTEDLLEPLLEEHPAGSVELLEAIVEKRVLPREIACKVWGDSIGVAYVEPITTIINRDAMELIPVEIATKARALPLYLFDTLLTVAMADPSDKEMVQKLGQIAKHPVSARSRSITRRRNRFARASPSSVRSTCA
jgi:type IV pilus assembly protein PilB